MAERGDFASGCPKLAGVYEATAGAGALFVLGRCLVKWGKLASGAAMLEVYRGWYKRWKSEIPAGNQSVHQGFDAEAAAMIEESKTEAPLLTVQGASECSLPTCRITFDGEPLGATDIAQPLPADPGVHELILEQNGKPAATTKVTLKKRGRTVAHISRPGKPLLIPVIAGGLGLAGITVGIIAGVKTMGEAQSINGECKELYSLDFCSQAGLDAAARAKDSGAVATVGFVLGGAGLAGAGLALWLQSRPAPDIFLSQLGVGLRVIVPSPGGLGLRLSGVW